MRRRVATLVHPATAPLHESQILPRLYVPLEDVRADLLERTDHATHCPFKGDASYWSVRVGDRVAENAVWTYEEPLEAMTKAAGFVSFDAAKVEVLEVA
jgi:uncharacterized protein (DUF427 family)